MARRLNTAPENNFIKGLITETTELKFPPNAAKEAMDVVFTNTGRVTRRPGFDFEEGYSSQTVTTSDTSAFSEFLWVNATGSGDVTLVVQQVDNTLYFYGVENDLVVSNRLKTFTVDLADYRPTGSALIPSDYLCSYSEGRGALIVVNKAIDPLLIKYSATSDTITVEAIQIDIRDYSGVDDGLGLTERITADVTSLKTSNPKHYYNILNQGWHAVDTLGQWDTARTDIPSNADVVALYRASEVDAFDAARVLAKTPGNTPAAKGHFILNAFDQDRTAAMIAEGFVGADITGTNQYLNHFLGTNLSHGFISPQQAFDGAAGGPVGFAGPNAVAQGDSDYSPGRLGKVYDADKPTIITQAVVYGTSDVGFLYSTSTVTLTLKASNVDPTTNSWSGTTLGTTTFSDTSNESAGRLITSSDTVNQYRYVWVEFLTTPMQSFLVTEVQFYTTGEAEETFKTLIRPTHVAHFAGRVFYAGVETPELNNNIYFTQIIENDDNYGKCYSYNDPTAESFSDPLATDGGVIRILSMAKVTGLFTYQNALIVFATNGVWLIQGGSGSGFKSTDYSVRKISSLGVNSPKSIVDYRGLPVWWGEDGINTIDYQSNYDSYTVTSLTFDTIRDFYYEIPTTVRMNVKGFYDVNNTRITWLYSTEDNGRASYNRALCFNPLTKAFYPWSISTNDVVGYPAIRGGLYLSSAERTTDSKLKFITSYDNKITFSEYDVGVHADWTTYANGNEDLIGDFVSYFITGYRHDAETNKEHTVDFLYVFVSQEINASCYVQLIADYATTPNSGNWSVRQEVYGNPVNDRSLTFRRLKMRGRHKSYQFKFFSNGSKPFSIVGWTAAGSGNTNV